MGVCAQVAALKQQLAVAKEQLKRQRSNGSGSLPELKSEAPASGSSCVHVMHPVLPRCTDVTCNVNSTTACVAQLGMRRQPSLL